MTVKAEVQKPIVWLPPTASRASDLFNAFYMRQTIREISCAGVAPQLLLVIVFAAMVVVGPANAAGRLGTGLPNPGLQYPGMPHAMPEDTSSSPYATNYSDEAAQSLGDKNQHMDLFSVGPTGNGNLSPTINGGLDQDGAMLKLQWHLGQ